MDLQTAINTAKNAAARNNKHGARLLLKKILQQYPNSIAAWLTLAEIIEDPEQARECLDRVLKLDPGNLHAIRLLEEIDNPFKDLYAFANENAVQQAGVRVDDPSSLASGQQEAIDIDPGVYKVPPQEPRPQRPTQPASRQRKVKKRSQARFTRTLEISLIVVLLVVFCVVAAVLLSDDNSLLDFGPTPTLENPKDVIYENMNTANEEDLDGYMNTIHPRATGRFLTRTAMADLFNKYDLNYTVSGLRLLELTEDEARVAFTLKTQKISGPAFQNNQVTGIMILQLDGREWKILDQEVTDISYLD